MIGITILGNNSASPAHGRHPTAQIVRTTDYTFLVDCGEGTQMQMSAYKVKHSKIDRIFISHLHGDHYFGLIGLINSFGLNQRESDLHIYAPRGLREVIELQLQIPHVILPFKIHFHVLEKEGILYEDQKISISAFKVKHGIPCFGFLFEEVRNPRRIDIDKVDSYQVPREFYANLQNGDDFVLPDGRVIKNEALTTPGSRGKSYAYCADTAYYEGICDVIRGADLIYHESTYLKKDADKAQARFHSTTAQAATIAKKAAVGKLLLGHYSSRYENIEPFQKEAKEIFENAVASCEGTCYLA